MLIGLPHLDDFGIQSRVCKRPRMSRLSLDNPPSIKSLPDEIAVVILEVYLKFEELAEVSFVSKDFYWHVMHVWRRCGRLKIDQNSISTSSRRTEDVIVNALHKLPNLKTLDLRRTGYLHPNVIMNALEQPRHPNHLCVTSPSIQPATHTPSGVPLLRLSLGGDSGLVSATSLSSISMKCTMLTHLALTRPKPARMSDQVLAKLHVPSLCWLDLSGFECSGDALASLVFRHPKLQTLSLAGNRNLDDAALLGIAKSQQTPGHVGLRSLRLGQGRWSVLGLREALPLLGGLQALALSQVQLEPEGWKDIMVALEDAPPSHPLPHPHPNEVMTGGVRGPPPPPPPPPLLWSSVWSTAPGGVEASAAAAAAVAASMEGTSNWWLLGGAVGGCTRREK